MSKIILLLCACCLITTVGHTQITNAQVNYELRVDQWRQTCDNDGVSNDDNEVRIGLTSDGNAGGTATWTCGGNGATCACNYYVRRWQADAPSTVTNANTLLYYCTNRNNAQDYFAITYNSWEEDGSPDCDPSGDACHSSGGYNYYFKTAAKTPSNWWAFNGTLGGAFMTGNSGDFFAKTTWRYTNGNACNNALNFGTLTSGVTRTHTNSNRIAPAGSTTTTMGYSNTLGNTAPDVYYQFTISAPSTVTIATNNTGTNFDTYLRLYNSTACGTQIAVDDDGGGAGGTSLITMDLCAGTYVALVEGYSAYTGDFNLSVLATTRPATGGTIGGITNGVAICPATDPGAFTDVTSPTGAGGLIYQWESSITSAVAGYSTIGGATGLAYDPPALSATTWFRRRVTDACGQVAYSNVIQVVVNTLSTAPTGITGTTTICNGGNTTLTVSGGSAGTGATARWYTASCGGTLVGSGNSVIVSPTVSTTYFVRYEGTCNTTTCASTTVTVNTLSTAPTAITGVTTICNGDLTTLTLSGGSAGTGATARWYTASCGGTLLGSGNSVIVSPTVSTTYYVRYEGSCNNTTCASATVTVNTLSTTPTGITGVTTICNGGNTTLTVFGGSAGTGATARWYTTSCGGILVGTGNSIVVAPTVSTTYLVRYEGTCNTTSCFLTTVTVNTLSTAPTAITGVTTICNGGSTTLTLSGGSAGTSATARWYTASCGGTLVGSGNSVIVSPTVSTTYFVRYEGTCNTTTCASTTVTVNTLSTTPTGITGVTTICNGGNTTLTLSGGSAGTSATARWYTASCGGTLVGSGNSVIVSPTVSTTYYVRYEGACNTTSCFSTTVTVNTLSTAPTISTIPESCPNTNITLSAAGGIAGTGSTIKWYSAAGGGGTLLGTGASITVAPMVTTTYYARREGSCNTTADDSQVAVIKTFNYATNNTVATTYCTDNDGWHHFYNGSEIILSVEGDLSGITAMTATIWDKGSYYVNGGSQTLCNVGYSPGEQQFEMERSWNVDYIGTLNGTYNVRYYYPMSERIDVETAAANWMATYTSCGYNYKYNPSTSGWFWFKNIGAPYVAPLYDGLLLSSAGTSTVNGINYSVITGVTSFSGGSGGVILVPDVDLPIDLVSFEAKRQNLESVRLDWVTATETNNAGFEIERMLDNETDFKKIYFVDGHGNTTSTQYYEYHDINSHTGVSYYRLKQVDFDGTTSYSDVRAVAGQKGMKDSELIIYPNPASDILHVYFGNLPSDVTKATVRITDVLGREVYSKTIKITANQVLEINELKNLPQASYLLNVLYDDGTQRTKQFVKQ